MTAFRDMDHYLKLKKVILNSNIVTKFHKVVIQYIGLRDLMPSKSGVFS